ncbi:MAG TPA: guanylate kinase [Thermodesulfovibrionales bacterium]|nr:guanylate kinase [Thermodesulfovibrionales bacterium]
MSKKHRGNLFIVSAPSGAGKTSLCQKLTAVLPNIRHSVSFTTREPRKGEVNDRDYTFLSEGEFMRMVDAGEFAEWARVHGNLYGTSKKRLEELRDEGINVILDIDTQGAKSIRKTYNDGVFIFILPPSTAALRERLEKRMSNPPEEIALRLKRASEEIEDYKLYDYVIVNSDFAEALMELKAIVIAEERRMQRIDPIWVQNTFRS